MEKRTKWKGFNDSVDNYPPSELFPFVGRALSPHTYTPQSHENLLRSFMQLKVRESSSKSQKKENKKLKTELKRLREENRRNQEEIQLLRGQQTNVNPIVKNKTDVNDSTSSEVGYNTVETLSEHFNEMMRRYHSTLADKNREIELLREKLTRYENRAHPSVEAERLRRTNAAVRVFRRDVDLVSTQLEHSPLDEQRLHCSSSRDRVVAEELRRRQRFGVIADLEAMGNRFFQRLEFEEKLDKLHWELESRRHLESGEECVPTCTYHQEFQMLEITRNNLLKALRDLREASTHQGSRTPLSVNTVQTLYRASTNNAKSNVGAASELPDK